MKLISSIVVCLAVAAGCSRGNPATSTAHAAPPPPAPPVVGIDPDTARKEALALGVGPCEDITRVKRLPFRDELGQDRQFDRMVVNFSGYQECLIGKLTDETPIVDPGIGPRRHPYAVGNLAYDIIGSAGVMDYEACVPREIEERWEAIGAQALVEWTATPGNRAKLQACVRQALAAPN